MVGLAHGTEGFHGGQIHIAGVLVGGVAVDQVVHPGAPGQKNTPGLLKGYRRLRVKGEPYPAIVPDADGGVQGALYRNVPAPAWERLDKFEGGMYARRQVRIALSDGTMADADACVVKPDFVDRLEASEWEYSEFIRSGKARFQKNYKGYRSLPPRHQAKR